MVRRSRETAQSEETQTIERGYLYNYAHGDDLVRRGENDEETGLVKGEKCQ